MAEHKPDVGTSVLTDAELLNKARNAENGRKFQVLYEQGWASEGIRRLYDSRRFAELALVVHLTWWARHEEQQIRRLFGRSAFTESADYPDYFVDLIQSAQNLLGKECYDPRFLSNTSEQRDEA